MRTHGRAAPPSTGTVTCGTSRTMTPCRQQVETRRVAGGKRHGAEQAVTPRRASQHRQASAVRVGTLGTLAGRLSGRRRIPLGVASPLPSLPLVAVSSLRLSLALPMRHSRALLLGSLGVAALAGAPVVGSDAVALMPSCRLPFWRRGVVSACSARRVLVVVRAVSFVLACGMRGVPLTVWGCANELYR